MTHRFKVGDRLVVTGDSQDWEHEFASGTIVTVLEVVVPGTYPSEDGYKCAAEQNGFTERWDVADEDLAPKNDPEALHLVAQAQRLALRVET
jgi:hypothetical protein